MEEKKNSESLELDFSLGNGLVFERVEASGGLVFEAVQSASQDPVPEKSSPEMSESVLAPEKKAARASVVKSELSAASVYEDMKSEKDKKNEPCDGEFALPDVFRVNEKYQRELPPQESTRIYTTYVPRFTGASDNYRMKNDPRPRPSVNEPVEKTAVKAEHVVNSEEKSEPRVAPTAEPKTPEGTETVVVSIPEKGGESLEGESFSIFKFRDEGAEEKRPTEEENSNRRALEELKARQAERRAREEAERLEREAAEREAARVQRGVKLSPEDYTMPDPDEAAPRVKRGRVDADYEVPHGIPKDGSSHTGKTTEFSRAVQRDRFKDRFLDRFVSVGIRLTLAVILSLALLFIENYSLLGVNLKSVLPWIESTPTVVSVIDLQLSACIFLLALPEVLRAVGALRERVLVPELSLAVSFAVLVAYTVIKVVFRYATAPELGFIFAVSATSSLVAAFLAKRTDFSAFRFISEEGEKTVLEHEPTRNFPRTMLALDGAVDGYRSNIQKSFRTSFVCDFFKNARRRAESTARNLVMLISSLLLALISATVAYFVAPSGAIETAVATFSLVAVFTVPAFSMLLHKLAYRHASLEAEAFGTVTVGEDALTENASVDVIAFEDKEIFGEDDVNLKRFAFFGSEENMNKYMRLVASLFESVGGPLSLIFSRTVDRRFSPASDIVIENDGVFGKVDGQRVAVGTAEYMLRQGIRLPEDNDRAYGIGVESTKVMYGAESGIVFAKFFIRYSFSEGFASLLPELKEERIVPLVYTSDPNITVELMRTLTMGTDSVRVMKRTEPSTYAERVYPRLSADTVTKGDPLSSARSVLVAKKYKRFVKGLGKAELAISAFSAAAAAAVGILFAFGTVPSGAFGLFSVLTSLVLGMQSKRKFSTTKKNKGK